MTFSLVFPGAGGVSSCELACRRLVEVFVLVGRGSRPGQRPRGLRAYRPGVVACPAAGTAGGWRPGGDAWRRWREARQFLGAGRRGPPWKAKGEKLAWQGVFRVFIALPVEQATTGNKGRTSEEHPGHGRRGAHG
ncbi:hypothetical protein EGU64_00260 [Achromobacter denitrificans]|nr:hypothetical protein EGU64_00260 [Achromobacter denitrificans]